MSTIASEKLADAGRATIMVRSERQAMDWSLVLASQDIGTTILAVPQEQCWGLEVSESDHLRALEAIRRYRLENRTWQIRRNLSDGTELQFHVGSILWCLLLVFIHACSAFWPVLIEAGAMESTKVIAGQWWRLLTAVTLHADLAHLMGNLTFGVIMLGLAMPRFGFGVTLLMTFMAGFLGNVAGLLFYPSPYTGVGASGMMMGALGLLAVYSVKLWPKHPRAFRTMWSGAGAGLLIFLLFGTNPKTDVVAHAAGFASGAIMGIGLSRLPNSRLKWAWLDWLAIGLLIVIIGIAWLLALRAAAN